MGEDERIYPCQECGTMRSKAEGGTTFTVCDECWDAKRPRIQDCNHSVLLPSTCVSCGAHNLCCTRLQKERDESRKLVAKYCDRAEQLQAVLEDITELTAEDEEVTVKVGSDLWVAYTKATELLRRIPKTH